MVLQKVILLHHQKRSSNCESSSAGRARPCQGRGRGFEPRLSLRKAPKRCFFFQVCSLNCWDGGIGRRAGLKILLAVMSVRVRFPLPVLKNPCKLCLQGFFYSTQKLKFLLIQLSLLLFYTLVRNKLIEGH